MKEILSAQALVILAIMVVPSALATDAFASTNNPPGRPQDSAEYSADTYRNLHDVAKAAMSARQYGSESPFSGGQTTNNTAKREATARRGARLGRVPLEMMKQSLGLSEEQAKELEPVLKEHQDKLNALRRETTLSRQQRAAKMKEIQASLDAKIGQHLTAEQAKKWRQMRTNPQLLNPKGAQPAAAAPPPARTGIPGNPTGANRGNGDSE